MVDIVKLKEFHVKKNGRQRRLSIELHKVPVVTGAATSEEEDAATNSQHTEHYYLRTSKRHFFGNIRKTVGHAVHSIDPFSSDQSIKDQLSAIEESPTQTPAASPARSAHTNITSKSGTTKGNGAGTDGGSTTSFNENNDDEQWMTRNLVELHDMRIVQVSGKKMTIHFKGGKVMDDESISVSSMTTKGESGSDGERQFVFKDVSQAHEFETAILHYKRLGDDLQTKRMDDVLIGAAVSQEEGMEEFPGSNINGNGNDDGNGDNEMRSLVLQNGQIKDEQIKFLIEIVGCEDLQAADIRSSDPYIVAKFNKKVLHKTKHAPKTLNPIFTLRKLSFFTWEVSARELFMQNARADGGLELFVYDYDAVGGNEFLGKAIVPPKDLYDANENRLTYILRDTENEKHWKKKLPSKSVRKVVNSIKGLTELSEEQKCGTISIRCRRATAYDEEFMDDFQEHFKKKQVSGILKKKEQKGSGKTVKKKKKRGDVGIGALQSMLETKVRTFNDEDGNKVKKMKVMPGPDPNDSFGTEWMTEEEIERAVLKPSRQFHYVGSGNVARVYLEILACDDLPNMETVTLMGNKTDAFVKIVYEDCICQTDIIDDKNSPRFLPWSNRAFVLHTNYPSSVINLGVFDYDPGTALLNDHDFIGRAAVDVTNLRPGTEYMLNYDLYDTALKAERRKEGVIKIRVRVEIDDPRAYLLASLSVPPTMYVNSDTKKNFECAHQSCNGKYDMNKYSLATIIELLCELAEQGQITYYISDFVMGLFLWRSTYKFSIAGKELAIPLNSMCAFIASITLVEYPRLLPSFSFLTLGWLLTVSMQWRIDHPNPWKRCLTFHELFLLLVFGKQRSLSPEEIAANERAEEAALYDKSWEDLIAKAEKKAADQAAEVAKEQEELYRELEEAGGADKDISTSTEGIGLNPIGMARKYLYPIQRILLFVCEIARFVRNIILWEESIYSFWVTFMSFALSVLLVFVPWAFILRWSSRIVAWTLFGPWMKVVDIYVYQSGSDTEESIAKREEAERAIRRKVMEKTITETRIKNELLIKLRDFKQYLFGKFLVRVPILKYDRYIDQPLPSSTAKLIKKEGATLAQVALAEADKLTHREMGQHLTGLMIPKVAEIGEGTKPGRAVLQQSLLEKSDPIGAAANKSDSSPLASMQIGSVLLFAGVVTYFAVPMLIHGVQYVTNMLMHGVS